MSIPCPEFENGFAAATAGDAAQNHGATLAYQCATVLAILLVLVSF
jgi:hypothetical protein